MGTLKPLRRSHKQYFRNVFVFYENNGGRRLFIDGLEVLEVTATNKLIKRADFKWGRLSRKQISTFAAMFAPKWLASMPKTDFYFRAVWMEMYVGDKREAK